jgi:hypothetical protein
MSQSHRPYKAGFFPKGLGLGRLIRPYKVGFSLGRYRRRAKPQKPFLGQMRAKDGCCSMTGQSRPGIDSSCETLG